MGSDVGRVSIGSYTDNFNPRSPCGERRVYLCAYLVKTLISIHAPRVGSDVALWRDLFVLVGFQSTLPVWGATCSGFALWSLRPYFNPRSPCGERRQPHKRYDFQLVFQSTLPVWGATIVRPCSSSPTSYFNPRSPCGERPAATSTSTAATIFQSTLPVWGATRRRFRLDFRRFYFNPRSPCGERRKWHGL